MRSPRCPRLVVSLSTALALAGCAQGPASLGARHEELRVCADGPTVDGIDVSHWQDVIDWDAVAASGVRFAFIRTTDGTATLDREYARNWAEARRVGILRGTYQFFRPSADAIAQADLLLSRMGTLEPDDLPPVIDVEAPSPGVDPATYRARIQAWLDRVEGATGRIPIIYTGFYYWRDFVGGDFTRYPLWIANYSATCPDVPDPWTRWAFFQTSSTGSVPGITGNVDTDLWNGDLTSLETFAFGVPVCGDGRCTGDETNASCAGDCPICAPIPPAGRTVEDDEVCFARGGNPAGWRDEALGSGGSLVWTYCILPPTDNFASWQLDFVEAGTYRVEVFTPAPFGASAMAPYTVRHAGLEETIRLDQGAVDGWQTLGEWDFAAAGDQWVRLEDGTGEPYSARVQIVFDAVRLTRIGAPDAGPSPSDAGPPPPVDASGADGGGAGESDGGARAREVLAGGCGCRAGARSGARGVLALAALLVVTLRRRARVALVR